MNALIVDDEAPNRDFLKHLITEYCDEVKVVGSAASAADAREVLKKAKVDVIFLDINMPGEDGFEFLNSIDKEDYAVVFVTAYQKYALKALKANALDYLLKPVDISELKEAVRRVEAAWKMRKNNPEVNKIYKQSLNNLRDNITMKAPITRLTIPQQQGFIIIDPMDICYLEADGSYTILHFADLKKQAVSKNIKEFEELLDPDSFFRTHKSAIINLRYLKQYSSVDGHFAIMNDNSKVMISRRRVEDFMNVVERFAQKI